MRRYGSFSLCFLFCTCCFRNLASAQNIKHDFEGEYSQTIKPSSSETLTFVSSIESETAIQVSNTNLQYSVPFLVSLFLRGDPKAIADYLLVNDIHLLDLDNEISASNFKHVSTRSTSIWTTVRYIQTYQGVPVYGTELAITVNQDDIITIVLGTYMSNLDFIEIDPMLTEEDVQDIVADNYVNGNANMFNAYESEFVVFQSTEGTLLAWKINLSYREESMTNSYEVLVSDADSTLFQETNLLVTSSSSGKGNDNGNGKNLRY